MLLIEQLKRKDLFTKSEMNIVDYILNNTQEIVKLNISELSQKTFSSTASIVRVCKKTGVLGFSEFKLKLASELNSFALIDKRLDPNMPFTESSDHKRIIQDVLNLQYQALTDTYRSLDIDSLWKAAEIIDKHDIVYLYGRGESLLPLKSFGADLNRIGKRNVCESINGLSRPYKYSDEIKECALILSQYASSKEIINIFSYLIEHQIPIILIHGNNKSLILKRATCSLYFEHFETHRKMAPISSRVIKHFILDTLFTALFSLHKTENERTIDEYSQTIFINRTKLSD